MGLREIVISVKDRMLAIASDYPKEYAGARIAADKVYERYMRGELSFDDGAKILSKQGVHNSPRPREASVWYVYRTETERKGELPKSFPYDRFYEIFTDPSLQSYEEMKAKLAAEVSKTL